MENGKFGIGIIGAGRIARSHIAACLELHDQCEILALADPNRENAVRWSSQYNLKAEIHEDYRELLANGKIDIVSICTPPSVREEPVIASLRAGKHVMCEKPFAASLEECDRMLEAASRYGRKLAVMLQTRCDSDAWRVRHLVHSGALGPILFAKAEDHHWRGDSYYHVSWRGTWEQERGGVLMNLGIHTLDLLLWIMGDLESVTAESGALGHRIQTDDVTAAILKFRGGAIGEFACTTVFPVSGQSLAFSGKSRMVSYPLDYAAVREESDGHPVEDPEAVSALRRAAEGVKARRGDFSGAFEDLFLSIREDRSPVTDGADVRKTVEAVTGIYKAAATGREVRFPITSEDPWYTTSGFHRLIQESLTTGRWP